MGKNNNNQPWQDIKRRMESAKAATQKPGGNLAGAASVQAPKLPKAPAVQSYANEKSANLFYTNPYNGGTMLTGVKPTITAPTVGSNLSGGGNSYRAANGVKPVAAAKIPTSLEQFRREIAATQQAIADIDKQQYGAMLKGESTDQHDRLRIRHEAELKQLQTAYAQAMGIGYKKPKNQLLPNTQTSAKDEADFWAGFRKGLGLKEGEEIGGGAGDAGFTAQDAAMHLPGMDDDYPEPEPDFPKEWPQEEEPKEDIPVPEPGPHPYPLWEPEPEEDHEYIPEDVPEWQNTCDEIMNAYESIGLYDANGINRDNLRRLYSESPEKLIDLIDMYNSLGLVNENKAKNNDRFWEIWNYNIDVYKRLNELKTEIQDIKDDALIEKNANNVAKVDSSRFGTKEDYYKYMISKYNELRNENVLLSEAFMENNLPRGAQNTYWSDGLVKEIGYKDTLEFMKGLDKPIGEIKLDHKWDSDKTNIGYGLVTIDGKDYGIIPLQNEEDYEVVNSVSCNDIEFNGAQFVANFSLEKDAPKWYPIVEVLSQAGKACSSVHVDVDIVENNGVQRAVIRYTNSFWLGLEKQPGETIPQYKYDHSFKITLDDNHTETEYGYIYCSDDGRTMVMPLIYPQDKIMMDGVDLTADLSVPMELSEDMVRRVEEAMANSGIYIDLP